MKLYTFSGVEIRENVLTGHKFTNLLKSVSSWGVSMVHEYFDFLAFFLDFSA